MNELANIPGIYIEKTTVERFTIEFPNEKIDLVNETLSKGHWRWIRTGPKVINARQASGKISQYVIEREVNNKVS